MGGGRVRKAGQEEGERARESGLAAVWAAAMGGGQPASGWADVLQSPGDQAREQTFSSK